MSDFLIFPREMSEEDRKTSLERIRAVINAEDVALARSFLDKTDEDWTFIDPEDVKRLARAVIEKAT